MSLKQIEVIELGHEVQGDLRQHGVSRLPEIFAALGRDHPDLMALLDERRGDVEWALVAPRSFGSTLDPRGYAIMSKFNHQLLDYSAEDDEIITCVGARA
jgi:hypothetical protein